LSLRSLPTLKLTLEETLQNVFSFFYSPYFFKIFCRPMAEADAILCKMLHIIYQIVIQMSMGKYKIFLKKKRFLPELTKPNAIPPKYLISRRSKGIFFSCSSGCTFVIILGSFDY